jgi:hypothetical protein
VVGCVLGVYFEGSVGTGSSEGNREGVFNISMGLKDITGT